MAPVQAEQAKNHELQSKISSLQVGGTDVAVVRWKASIIKMK
jgi:hypothetical protein